MEVLSSYVGIASLGLAAVPMVGFLSVYVVSALLTTTRFGLLDGVSFKHTSLMASGGVAGVGLVLMLAGPYLPGPGLLLAGASSWWAYVCSDDLDKQRTKKK